MIDSRALRLSLSGGAGRVSWVVFTLKATESRESERAAEWLEIGLGAQILSDLGLRNIRILSGREVDYVGLQGFGLTLDATELLTD